MLGCISRCWLSCRSFGTIRNGQFKACTSCFFCQSRACRPVQRRRDCLRFTIPPLAPSQRHYWWAVGCDRPSLPPMITFSSLLPYHTFPPFTQQRRLTHPAVISLIQKTSKQMRCSPVQRCRPAAHASCQETPRTCWLCTFPAKQSQM